MDSRLTLPHNTVLDGSYRIERVVGSGGFGITYEAEDMNLGTSVAIKEYYPFDFGDRDSTMSVRPKSDRHRKTFDWGRSNFLEEARTLARFEHPSIVRVTRVFEANSTAYMVMRFEQGQSFEQWIRNLGRPPTQEELDSIITPLLEALQMMHRANFLHRDIAPDNIIVRSDGSPVLLDFGAARRAVAEMSHSLTGIVKPGYSPHEQYTSDNRLQGPWSDLYALGGTLYRAVTGHPPEEATLRVDADHMPSAVQAAQGTYRKGFLKAIDACLKVRGAERPQSVTQLRSKLLGRKPPSKPRTELLVAAPKMPSRPRSEMRRHSTPRQAGNPRRWPAIAAAFVAILGGAYGGYEFIRWQPEQQSNSVVVVRRKAEETAQWQAKLDADRQLKDEQARVAADAEDKRRAAEAEASLRAEEQWQAEERRRVEAAERRRIEENERIAAKENARRAGEAEAEEKRKDEVRRTSAVLSGEERATFVKRVQEVLQKKSCYHGAINGRLDDTQKGLDRFADGADRKGKPKPARIELAKATVSDFESWLRNADDVRGEVCFTPKPPSPPPAQRQAQSRPREEPAHARPREEPRSQVRRYEPSPSREHYSSRSGGGGSGVAPIQGIQ